MAQRAGNETSDQSTDSINISIKAPGDSKISVSISLSKTVLDLKRTISDQTDPRVEAENQRLIYSGRVLKDEVQLSEYRIQSGHSIHMVKGAPRPAVSSTATQQIPSNLNAGQQIAGNPLAPLLNATNQIPGFNPFADLGINTNDPNMAMNMMNNPQMLQNAARLLEDPAVVDSLIASDPRLQAMGPHVREMLRSPMMRQMLTDPEMMRNMYSMNPFGGGPNGGPAAFGTPTSTAARTGTTTDPVAAALGATAAQPTSNNQAGAGTTPGGNNLASSTAPGGAVDPMAFLNSPFGQMAMQQMNSGGMGMMGGMGFPYGHQTSTDQRPPEERFEVQLGQLQAMGFSDARQNVRALLASGGNVEAAIEYILGGNQ
ncbi:hypothetical protein BY996DRAFT_4584696 [Phakopsora pachyrhizi]|uniref:Ubiquilin n=1 Tax=Phakopsora pachyrhizi TaxID=170000 RepID=A0AAV0AV85_PHAPC|nr:hypothetical protein BY996DRAFT_4584696 [Phakopsora pachyrhizi]CAH7673883.1 hypothetical protein PPACK8108_LOCUS8784 [Phakopsora pachyrhizi]